MSAFKNGIDIFQESSEAYESSAITFKADHRLQTRPYFGA